MMPPRWPNLPAEREIRGDVGVESRLRLKGDFEITLEYELLALPDPGPELGAGVALQILLDTPDAFKARMSRSRKAAGARFGANFIVREPDGKDRFNGLSAVPGNDKETKGHLRVSRTGGKLSYQIEEGGTGFRTIATKNAGPADVIAVEASCATGWKPLALDVRFARLELRAGEIPEKGMVALSPEPQAPAPQAQPIAAQPASRLPAVWWVTGLGAVFSLVLIVGLVVFLRKAGPVARAQSPAVYTCPACSKVFKLNTDPAGKKVKCPKCGDAVLVAESRA